MTIEIGNLFKSTCNMSFASKGFNSIFCNKIYTSIILSIIIVIIITIIYPSKSGTKLWVFLKLGFYICISGLLVLFVHDGVVFSENNKKMDKEKPDAIEGMLDNSMIGEAGVRVAPKLSAIGGDEDLFAQYGV